MQQGRSTAAGTVPGGFRYYLFYIGSARFRRRPAVITSRMADIID